MIKEDLLQTNPDFNPDWQEIQDERGEILDQKLRELETAPATTSQDDLIRLSEAVENAKDAYLATYRMKHRYLAEHIEAIETTHFNRVGAHSRTNAGIGGIASSFEEANESWRRMRDISKHIRSVEAYSLPIYSSENYDGAFAFGDHESRWCEFTLASRKRLSALVMVEARNIDNEDIWNCVIMQDPDFNGASVLDNITELANRMMREKGQYTGFTHAFNGSADKPHLKNCNFFVHVPPENGCREFFAKIDFQISNGEFHSPEWQGNSCIPSYVQTARFHTPKPVRARAPDYVAQSGEPANDI